MEKFKVKVTIFATFIAVAYGFLNNQSLVKICYSGISTIIVFYILGGFIEIGFKKYEQEKNKNTLKENLEEYTEEIKTEDLEEVI